MSNKLEFLKKYGVDVEKGIENTIDEETYNEILEDYFNELTKIMNDLANYRANNDMTNYAITVHALKSNSRTLGFMSFGERCYQHEMESKNNNTQFINADFENLLNNAKNVYAIIKAYKSL